MRIIFLFEGHLYYCTDDPEKDIAPFIDVFDESYEEVQVIVYE